MRFIKRYVAVMFVLFLSSIFSCDAQKSGRIKHCHMNQVTKCFDNLRYFAAKTNGTGIVITENEYNYSCGQKQIGIDRCAPKWFKRCGNSLHFDIFNKFFRNAFKENIDEMCDLDSPLRKTFLKQSPCLHYKVKQLPEYRTICVKDLQAGYEYIQDTFKYNLTEQFQSLCCVYNRWEKCITDFLIEKCGPQQDQSIRILIGFGTTHILEEVCKFDKFDPTSDLCQKYFQPKDMMPKGLKSNSYPSWFFSWSCPNIGYGIIPERDTI